MKPALFLDRDGVMNEDLGYVYKLEDIRWVPGIVETIDYFNRNGYSVIVISNQSGVARGYYHEDDVVRLHLQMKNILAQSGVTIDHFYFCPHHPEALVSKYKLACNCRKPNTGMVQQALKDYPIDLNRSLLIGDKQSDIELAENMNINGYRFTTGNIFTFFTQHILPALNEK